ncbi:MAG: DUF4864 domain-containing protein [Cyanobacteria bacterium J06635_11]
MELTQSDAQKIRTVIERQIAAFLQDDFSLAFSQAAPGIQIQFGTATNFVRRMESAYPSVHRPRSVVFESLRMIQEVPSQQVILMDQSGELIRATYTMQKQQNNSWKIAGCYLTPMG